MNPQEARERADLRRTAFIPNDVAEQEAADQAEEERVAREDRAWGEAEEDEWCHSRSLPWPPMPPWLFADERSQRKAEAMAREERPWDDYSPWQNEQLFR